MSTHNRLLLGGWLLSRVLVIVAAVTQLTRATLFSDPNLLWAWANGVAYGSDTDPALDEYPGAARLLALSGRLARSHETFGWGWIAALLLVDLLVLVVLVRTDRRAGWLWVVAGAALGPVMWLRYDLLVALLALVAVLQRDRRPAISGMLLAAAILLKLWPAVLLAALLPRRGWQRLLGASAGVLAFGVSLELLLSEPSSVLGPFTYQSDRGLQIESLAATPSLVAGRDQAPDEVWEFAFRAYQVQDSDSGLVTLLAVVVLASVGVAVLWATHRCHEQHLAAVRVTGSAVVVVALVAANSVFSPQYVMWFLPFAVLVAAQNGPHWPMVAATVGVAGLTQVIWPWSYKYLLALEDWTLAVLVTRNVIVVVLGVLLAIQLWSLARERTPQPVMKDSRT